MADVAADPRAEAVATAGRILDQLTARAPSAEVAVTVRLGTEALTRFANGFIHQNVASDVASADVLVVEDGRATADGLDGVLSDDAVARLADRVLEAVRLAPVDAEWPGLTPPMPGASPDHWDDATADASPDARAAQVAAFVDAADGVTTNGAFETGGIAVAFANSLGHRIDGRFTVAGFDGLARGAAADGSARSASARIRDVDGGPLGRRAAEKARSGEGAADLDAGRYEVVLEPSCVADILGFLFAFGFNGRTVNEGTSFVRLGEAQFDPSVTMRDDAGAPATVGIGFDLEGTPRQAVTVVDHGVTRAALHSRRTAARAGTSSTGHAGIDFGGPGADAANISLDAGDRSVDDLIGAVRRGVLVTDFWYTRILDPRTQVVTGLTRNGAWLIEDGAIVRPVRNLRFTQSYLDALGPGNVLGVGARPELVLGHFGGSAFVPAVHLGSWNFTGNARG